MANVSRAWLLDFGRGFHAAVGAHEMSHIELSMTLYEIPQTPHYCNEVIIWQDFILPVLDIPSLMEGHKISHAHSGDVIGIVVYQEHPTLPIQSAALHLATTPVGIHVSDDDACSLSTDQQQWQPLALSCFSYHGMTIPILNLAHLFSKQFNTFKFSKTN